MVTTVIGLAALTVLRVSWLAGTWLRLHYAERARQQRHQYVLTMTKQLPSGVKLTDSDAAESVTLDYGVGSLDGEGA